jgi:2,3-dihydroxybenzoate decarboxylase
LRKIAIEEHFTTHTYQEYVQRLATKEGRSSLGKHPPQVETQLMDLGESRLRAMDEAEIAMQVLSLTVPGLERVPSSDAMALARDINDELAESVHQNPRRFAGFAALPTLQPQAAADELERAVLKLGFKGAIINGQPQNSFLDDKSYWEIFAQAQALGVPIYLHPTAPSPDTLQAYEGRPELVGPLWSFTVDTATQALRLIFSGTFDRYPNLTVILGHLGETLPYLLWRLDSRWKFSASGQHLSRLPSQYMQENMLVTTSGMFYDPALLCACMTLGADRILFAVDYPFEWNKAGSEFIERAPLTTPHFSLVRKKLLATPQRGDA